MSGWCFVEALVFCLEQAVTETTPTLSAGASVGDRGLRKKCGLTELILSRYLSRFSLHCDRVVHTETVVGPAKESVGNSGSVFLLNCHSHDVSYVCLSNLIEVSVVYPRLVRPKKESDCSTSHDASCSQLV